MKEHGVYGEGKRNKSILLSKKMKMSESADNLTKFGDVSSRKSDIKNYTQSMKKINRKKSNLSPINNNLINI